MTGQAAIGFRYLAVKVNTPESLEVVFVILALFAGGMITFREKGRNYMLRSYDNAPTHAHVYKDGKDVWHFALYRHNHRLDPVLAGPEAKDDLIQALENLLSAMANEARWHKPHCPPALSNGSDFVVRFEFDKAGADGGGTA